MSTLYTQIQKSVVILNYLKKDVFLMKIFRSLVIAAAAVGAGAGYFAYKNIDDEKKKMLKYDIGDKAIRTAVRGLASAFPGGDFPLIQEYVPENFFAGTETFIDNPKAKAKWSLGYASESILSSMDYTASKHYVGGYLAYPANVVDGIIDDQCVRAIALDDGSDRGVSVFSVIDCIGIAGTDIRRIRARLSSFAAEHGINCINISATHCHSGVDTQGLWGDLLPDAIVENFKKLRKGETDGLKSGRNPEFMENLYVTAAETIKTAVENMKKGTLYCSVSDEKKYSHDKRLPDVTEKDLTMLRFVPDDDSRQTIAVFAAAHPVALGEKNTKVSSDFPYYMVDELNKNNYNGIFFQGPQLAVTTSGDFIDEELKSSEQEGYMKFGRGLARYAMSLVGTDKEKAVKPILNVRIAETFIPAENEVFMLIGKVGLVTNIILKSGRKPSDLVFVTEVGYVQLGENQRFALVPGEFAPELLLGGAFDASESYRKQAWELPPMKTMVKPEAKLTVIGLCNDSIGYILPANDYGSITAPKHYEESVSAGPHAAEIIVKAFQSLVDQTSK